MENVVEHLTSVEGANEFDVEISAEVPSGIENSKSARSLECKQSWFRARTTS